MFFFFKSNQNNLATNKTKKNLNRWRIAQLLMRGFWMHIFCYCFKYFWKLWFSNRKETLKEKTIIKEFTFLKKILCKCTIFTRKFYNQTGFSPGLSLKYENRCTRHIIKTFSFSNKEWCYAFETFECSVIFYQIKLVIPKNILMVFLFVFAYVKGWPKMYNKR